MRQLLNNKCHFNKFYIYLIILNNNPVKLQGKVYLFIEAVSQLYRSIAAIQPWLYYLLESYQGPEKIVAVFLSAFYMISKGTDLMSRMKLLKTAFFKVLQNVVSNNTLSYSENAFYNLLSISQYLKRFYHFYKKQTQNECY